MMGMTENIGGFSGPIAEEMLPPLQSMGWSHNDSSFNCQDIFCNLFEDIGPPPDWLPPPPLPPYLLQLLNENHSLIDEGTNDCNFCHVFSNPTDSELVVTKPEFKTNDYWFSLLLGSIIGSTILCIILLFILFKFRKWKLFPSSVCGLDSCPIFLESMNKGLKDAPPPCAPSDNCILPVVNEKSPQSVITSCPTKTSISSKYWRRNEENPGSRDGRVDSRGADMEEYTNIPDGGSCTSSSVYAELDAAGVTINHSQIPSSLLLNEPSPYVFHTYSEIADAMRMAALDSSTALLPDVSYDNVAYLPSSNSDHYQNRSLRRQRSGLGHLGSAAPLLHTHQQMIIGSQMNFATGGQPHKKPRPVYSHHTSRINARNHQEQLQQQQQQQLQQLQQQQQQMQMQMQSEIDARYMSARRSEAVYSDFPRNSPSLATFQVPYAANFRENPKRPLPAVPGVRL